MIKRYVSHLYPKYFNLDTLGLKKTFYAGSVSLALFLNLCISGALLLLYYSPEPLTAYSSIVFIEEKVFAGRFIRAFHLWNSHLLLIFITVHMIRTIFTGAYTVRNKNWKLGYLLFGLIVFEAYTGVLLPMDQLSYWATQTGMELAGILPFGAEIKKLLSPDGVGGKLTILRFFALHIAIIPFVSILLISAHLYNIRKDGGLQKTKNDKKTLSDPALYKLTIAIAFITILITTLIAILKGAPLEVAANPALPPNPAKSAWFLIWIQEIVSWHAWFFYPFVLLVFLFYFLPDIRRSYKPEHAQWFAKEDIATWTLVLLLCITVLVLTAVGMFFRGENWTLVPFYF